MYKKEGGVLRRWRTPQKFETESRGNLSPQFMVRVGNEEVKCLN